MLAMEASYLSETILPTPILERKKRRCEQKSWRRLELALRPVDISATP
jgi:hypothetical protein